MSDTLNIGKIITTEQRRDAVHFPISPTMANETLYPAQHVGLLKGSTGIASTQEPPIGIVDPFLKGPVYSGQVFWLFLYQNTVTGMRHEWTHPAFSAQAPKPSADDVEASKKWIAEYAGNFNLDYDRMMNAALEYIEDGEIKVQHGDESWRNEFYATGEEFWNHYEIVTGKVVEDKGCFFSCSC
jgi:hypothetical protein